MNLFVRFASLSILGAVVALTACGSSSNLGTPGGGGGDGGVGGEGGPGPVIGVPAHHVTNGATCRTTRGPGNTSGFTCPDAGNPTCCSADSDCTAGNNGRCTVTGNGGPHCTYDECFTSSDCDTGKSCACGDINDYSYNICVTSNCRSDADCGAGGYCSPSLDFTCGTYGGEYAGLFCHTAQDQCTNDSDCTGPNGRCSYNPETSRWECATGACAG